MNLKKFTLTLILFTPLFRGLYFQHSQFIFTAIIIIFLGIIIIKNKCIYVSLNYRSFCAIILVILYGISTLYAVDSGMAILGFLKWLGILIFYLLILQVYEVKFKERYLLIIAYSGIMLAVVGIIGAFIPWLRSICYQNNRLGSLIQYANSLSVFLLISYIIIIFKEKKNNFDKLSLGLLICGIFLTFSRSMNFITFCILLFIIIKEKRHLKLIIITCLFGLLLGYLISISTGLMINVSRVANSLNFKASEWQCRLAYYTDALSMIKNNIFGLGYLGYFYSQKIYQTAIYYVKYVHSSFLQIGLDVGITGLICSLVIFFDYLKNCEKSFKELIIVLIIISHSIIDFDFEFPIFLMLISVLFVDKKDIKKITINSNISKSIIFTGLIIYLYFGITCLFNYLGQYSHASRLYPLFTEANTSYAQNLLVSNIRNERKKGVTLLEKIIKQNDSFQLPYILLSDYYLSDNKYEKAVIYAEYSKKTAPLEIEFVEKYSQTLLISAKYAIIKNDFRQAKEYLKSIQNIKNEIYQTEKKISDRAYTLAHIPNLKFNMKLHKITNEANELLKEVSNEK